MVLWSIILALFLLVGTWLGGFFLGWALWLKILLTVLMPVSMVTLAILSRWRMVM